MRINQIQIWICRVAGLAAIAFVVPAKADALTYKFINASASFTTDSTSTIGYATSFTLEIGGTFSIDTVSQVATATDITLSGLIPPEIDQFEAYSYSAVFSNTKFSGASFSAINPPFDDVISFGFVHPFDNSADQLNAFLMTSPAFGGFTDTSVTGMAVRIPEPSTLGLLAGMFCMLGGLFWFRVRLPSMRSYRRRAFRPMLLLTLALGDGKAGCFQHRLGWASRAKTHSRLLMAGVLSPHRGRRGCSHTVQEIARLPIRRCPEPMRAGRASPARTSVFGYVGSAGSGLRRWYRATA